MHSTVRFSKDTFFTDIWYMVMDYALCIQNIILDMKSGLYYIDIWSRLNFETVSEPLSNHHVFGCLKYVLNPKFQNSRLKSPKWSPKWSPKCYLKWYLKWSPKSQICGIYRDTLNTSCICYKPSDWLNFTAVSCFIWCYFSIVVSSTAVYPYFQIRLVRSSTLGIQVMLDQ